MLLYELVDRMADTEPVEIWADSTMIGVRSGGEYMGLTVDSDLLADLEVIAISSRPVKVGDEWSSVLVVEVEYEEE